MALTVADRNNPHPWVEVKGLMIEDTYQGALEHIHKLAKKYVGEEEYPSAEAGEQRLTCRVKAEKVSNWNPALLGPGARAYLAAGPDG